DRHGQRRAGKDVPQAGQQVHERIRRQEDARAVIRTELPDDDADSDPDERRSEGDGGLFRRRPDAVVDRADDQRRGEGAARKPDDQADQSHEAPSTRAVNAAAVRSRLAMKPRALERASETSKSAALRLDVSTTTGPAGSTDNVSASSNPVVSG